MLIRRTRPEDIDRLPAIETAAGSLFRTLPGLAWLADEEPSSVTAHRAHADARLSWVAVLEEEVESREKPVGFLIAERHDAALHVLELSVHPDAQRRGIGAALLRRGIEEAGRLGLPAATLTTFVDVPWNGPFYARHGFDVARGEDLTEDLRRILDAERDAGLPMHRRVAMHRVLDGNAP